MLETARGGMLRRGLGYDWTDVGVITNITADHLGQDGLDIDRGPRARQGAGRRAGPGRRHAGAQRRRPVGTQPGRPAPGARRPQADRLVRPRPGNPVIGRAPGQGRHGVRAAGRLAGAGHRRPADAAAPGRRAARRVRRSGAARRGERAGRGGRRPGARRRRRTWWSSGWPTSTRPAHNPGRGTLLRRGEVSLFVDYAHNPAALAAVLRTLHRLWGPDRCVAAVTLPGDRRDDLLAASAQVLADGVTRVVLYDDEDPRGRAPGEVSALVEREMRAGARSCARSGRTATGRRSRRPSAGRAGRRGPGAVREAGADAGAARRAGLRCRPRPTW